MALTSEEFAKIAPLLKFVHDVSNKLALIGGNIYLSIKLIPEEGNEYKELDDIRKYLVKSKEYLKETETYLDRYYDQEKEKLLNGK